MEPTADNQKPKKNKKPADAKGGNNRKKRRPPRIEIRQDFCKACGICVEFCPAGVLAMKQNTAYVKDLKACTKCMMCELRCPDFAISVFDPDKGEI